MNIIISQAAHFNTIPKISTIEITQLSNIKQ